MPAEGFMLYSGLFPKLPAICIARDTYNKYKPRILPFVSEGHERKLNIQGHFAPGRLITQKNRDSFDKFFWRQ